MDYILTVALNYLFDVVWCDLKSDSQTFEFYTAMKRITETRKTIGDHDKWIVINNFLFLPSKGILKLPFTCYHHFKRETILTLWKIRKISQN